MHRLVFTLVLVPALLRAASPVGKLTTAELRDRIAGGWAGQMIGVSYGAPTEFKSNAKINTGELPAWTPDRVSNAIGQDDLYVDMTFAKVLDDKGLNATTEDFGNMFREAKYQLWHANLAARRALKRGVPASLSGTPRYNAHANDIDFQIEADFAGLMAPGLPNAGNEIATRAGRVMNYGDGIYGGLFITGMYASAFFENDVRKVVEAGLKSIPAKSPYALLISDLLAWAKQYPDDWQKVWHLIEDKWDKREPCPSGALKPFNIDAKLNGAYLAMGLLYGGKDFGKTIEIATRAGQDSDCNPASAGGILGVMLGYKAIPEIWKGGIPKLADTKFDFTEYSFNTIVESTRKRAIALILKNGGSVKGDNIVVRIETPKAPKLQIWDDYGSPVERIAVKDARFQWTGDWAVSKNEGRRTASNKGADVTIVFDGTGAILTGPYTSTGGKADVYLDGKLQRTVDANSDEEGPKGDEAIWHMFGLPNTKHKVRLVVKGEPMWGGKGTEIALEDLIVFRP